LDLPKTLKDFKSSQGPGESDALIELACADGQISYNPRYLEEADILEFI